MKHVPKEQISRLFYHHEEHERHEEKQGFLELRAWYASWYLMYWFTIMS